MTRQEAVVLSYLEWVRLINTGGIRLDEGRITRWSPQKTAEKDVVAELMRGAPDLGTSANAFVLVMLEPDVLDRIRSNSMDLGKRLSISMVRSFHSFTETAWKIHSHDAAATDSEITLSSMSKGWLRWVDAVENAEREAKGKTLAQLFSLTPGDCSAEWIQSMESRIDYEKIAKSRDTMFYGWACVLNSIKARRNIETPADVSNEIRRLQKDFNVEQPFLDVAPLLREFVEGLRDPKEKPSDLLALAALKQHERYVTKRDGAALDVEGLTADVEFLKARDAGSATMLVQVLGERLPPEIVWSLEKSMAGRGSPEPYSENATDNGAFEGSEKKGQVRRTVPQGDSEERTGVDGAQAASGAAEVSEQAFSRAVAETGGADTSQPPASSAADSATDDSNISRSRTPIAAEQCQGNSQEEQPSLFSPSEDADTPVAEPKEEGHVAASTEESGQQPQPLQGDGAVTGMYAPLYKYLQNDVLPSQQSVQLSFEEIDDMLNEKNKLPDRARKSSSFWSNDAKGRQVKAWINAGFFVSESNLEEGWVRFKRASA